MKPGIYHLVLAAGQINRVKTDVDPRLGVLFVDKDGLNVHVSMNKEGEIVVMRNDDFGSLLIEPRANNTVVLKKGSR